MSDDAEARCQAAAARIRNWYNNLPNSQRDEFKTHCPDSANAIEAFNAKWAEWIDQGIDDAEMEANWPMGDK